MVIDGRYSSHRDFAETVGIALHSEARAPKCWKWATFREAGSGKRVRRWEHITGPARLCVKEPICVSQRALLNLRQDAITFMLPISIVWRLRCVPLLTGGIYAKLQIGCGSFYSN